MTESRNPRQLGKVERKCVPELVQFAEELLQKTKSGEITSIAICWQIDGDGLGQFLFGQRTSREEMQYIGQLDLMKTTLVMSLLTEDQE